jgi:hypothetical protein
MFRPQKGHHQVYTLLLKLLHCHLSVLPVNALASGFSWAASGSKVRVSTILAKVYTPDDSRVGPEHVVMRYMKDGNECCI